MENDKTDFYLCSFYIPDNNLHLLTVFTPIAIIFSPTEFLH